MFMCVCVCVCVCVVCVFNIFWVIDVCHSYVILCGMRYLYVIGCKVRHATVYVLVGALLVLVCDTGAFVLLGWCVCGRCE